MTFARQDGYRHEDLVWRLDVMGSRKQADADEGLIYRPRRRPGSICLRHLASNTIEPSVPPPDYQKDNNNSGK